jgi:diguanylate cyclase (GGDEF)-like protein
MSQGSMVRRVIGLVALTAVYAVAATLGMQLAFLHASVGPFRPATAIALTGVLLLGRPAVVAIAVGAFLVHWPITGSAGSAMAIGLGNAIEALVAATLISRWVGGRDVFGRPRRVVRFTVLAAAASCIGATVGPVALELAGVVAWPALRSLWVTWWLGSTTGMLVVAPVILLWIARPTVSLALPRVAEAAGVLGTVVLGGQLVFGDLSPAAASHLPLGFLTIPPVLWAAFRFGPRETATAVLLLSAMAIRGTLGGLGPFVRATPHDSLVLLQAFLGVLAVIGLAVAAAIAHHRHTEGRLRSLSVSDPLTGLANHRQLVTEIENEIERAGRTERPFALLFLDLDDLKVVNDRHGHLVGSRALCRLAEALRATCRAVDTIARYGGDEFAVVLPESGEEAAWEVVRRLTERLERDREHPPIRASMGVAVFPRDGASAEELLGTADRALYAMKRARPEASGGTRTHDLPLTRRML